MTAAPPSWHTAWRAAEVSHLHYLPPAMSSTCCTSKHPHAVAVTGLLTSEAKYQQLMESAWSGQLEEGNINLPLMSGCVLNLLDLSTETRSVEQVNVFPETLGTQAAVCIILGYCLSFNTCKDMVLPLRCRE